MASLLEQIEALQRQVAALRDQRDTLERMVKTSEQMREVYDGITRDEVGRYVAIRSTRAVFDSHEDAARFMRGEW